MQINNHPERGKPRPTLESEAAQKFRDAADRFEIRNEPVTAMYFRNQAWRIENGHEWLEDANV